MNKLKQYKKLNILLYSFPVEGYVEISGKDIELMRTLEKDGLVKVNAEKETGIYITTITSTGILFRLNGGYKRSYNLGTYIAAILTALATLTSAVYTILNNIIN